jgi:hypothetical protein
MSIGGTRNESSLSYLIALSIELSQLIYINPLPTLIDVKNTLVWRMLPTYTRRRRKKKWDNSQDG